LLHRQREAAARVAEFQAELDRLKFGYRPEEKAQAKAKVDNWQARWDALDPEQGPRRKEIEAAEARLQVALAQKELAEQAFERKRGLHAQNVVSDAELEAVTEDLKVATNQFVVRDRELQLLIQGTDFERQQARAQLREAEAAWELMENGFRVEEVRKAEAALESAKAELEAVQAQRDELIIRAPSEATVEAIELQPGDMVAAGAPVLSLVDRRRLWVRAYVPGALDVQVDQRVYIVVDGRPGASLPARVVFRARQAEFTPSNVQTIEERTQQVFRIKVALEPQENLWPGMTADVWFQPPDES
jgi:multidrug resistance efflux pump